MNKFNIKKTAILKLCFTFLILIVAFTIINLFTATTTLSNIEETWDGVEIATSFSGGNGTKENPYQIKNGSELAYLRQIIEGQNISNLKDVYFVLTNNIDLGGHNWSGIGNASSPFSGHIDGQGYSINNFSISTPTMIDNIAYYSFFNIVSDAEMKNINFNNIDIVTMATSEPITLGFLIGNAKGTNTINNISVANTTIDLSKTLANKDSKISGVIATAEENTSIENIYLQTEITDNNANSFGNLFFTFAGQANNIVSQTTYTNFLTANIPDVVNSTENTKIENSYKLVSNNNTLSVSTPENTNLEDLIERLNQTIESNYRWIEENGILKIARNDTEEMIEFQEIPILFNFGKSASIVLHDTGITETTVYINDLDSDYNYYQGLNYTQSTTGALPSGQNQGLYTDNNLVKVYIKYSGQAINDSSLVGHVGLDEPQSEFIYYKYYPVEQGYVTIDLIDNPFADHPNNKGFNGWITDYPNAVISYDDEIYTRYVTIPVTYTNGIPDIINITFYSNWLDANVGTITRQNDSWDDAFSELKPKSMQLIKGHTSTIEDMSAYYVERKTDWFSSYPNNAYNTNLNRLSGLCIRPGGCTYYTPSSSEYDPNETYYRYNGTRLVVYTPQFDEESADMIETGSLAGGFFKEVTLSFGQSISGYYNSSGIYQESGTCTSSSCTYYELQQYYNADGSINVINDDDNYYYFVTRDMNIVVLQTNIDIEWDTSKPFTLTGIWNDRDYSSNTFDITYSPLIATSDTRIEYITINSGQSLVANSSPTSSSSYRRTIYGGWHNFKIGRGIKTSESDSIVANSVLAGDNESIGSSSDVHRYKMIVESGTYNMLSATNGTSSRNMYIDGYAVYGGDYDRASNNNELLDVYFCASGSWGGYVHSSTNTGIAIHTNIKSGTFGSSKYDYSTGVYVGGRQGGTHYAARDAIVEGGYIYNLIGGPLTDETRTSINDTFINVKGGTIDMVVGGAGASETYGNRIINFTSGTVNYGVFGGSNGYTGSDSGQYKGTLSGDTLVYVGGNAVVGNDNLINSNSNIFGVESGNVFGIGNGNSNSSKIGSANNSLVIIDGNATIKSSVYGGGNYGATGLVPSTDSDANKESITNIKILGGIIHGSVYGGGNNNGSGGTTTYESGGWYGETYTTNVTSDIYIEMTGGTVKNSIYGGSRVKGTVYGNTNIQIVNGTIEKDVYGGGEGGYSSSNRPGTFVKDNVSITIGNTTGPTIYGSIYGGSAYGSVNGTTNNGSANNKSTTVTVNQGVIQSSVFGGGKGDSSYTPKVYGNVTLTINGGNIGSVYGGNDVAGSPSNKDIVYLNNGTIGKAFGGGNKTGQINTNIYLQGATITDSLFGGSNESGNVTTTNVYIISGTANNIFGGNNLGGTTTTNNVEITGGRVTGSVYGGGNKASSKTIHLYVGNAIVENVYGGGNEADATTITSKIEGATITNLFGGSNQKGTVNSTTLNILNGNINSLYGGNNQAGTTSEAIITIENGTIGDIYGGGNEAESIETEIIVNNGSISNIYGGGNEAGLTNTKITVIEGNVGNIYGGSNISGEISSTRINIGNNNTTSLIVDNIYGGNNMGGITDVSSIEITRGSIGNIYGGGNEAEVNEPNIIVKNAVVNNIYGGGNMAAINEDTKVEIKNTTVNTNVYGGGNYGEVLGNTLVNISSSNILGSAYGGGNGASAIVNKNTEINVEGNTAIGSETSKAPHQGCLFGGGNAAATGTEANNNSTATVNIVGGKIYGNVYGGANTSVVYGKTDTNIGTKAVGRDNLEETTIDIGGTVFGGGEANAEGSENYDFSFISVTGAIDIDIDGEGYLSNNYNFNVSGSIFGSGNASSSSGTSVIRISNLGTRENPSENISIQRANKVVLDNTVMELVGTTDRTNEYSDIEYSLNRIDELNIKNNSMLLLQRNANLLQSLKSTVDINGEEEKAAVIIDDDTKTVNKNVDNRIYMLANRNLNITTNEAATEYGEVSGMTFFGMYQKYGNGSFSYGLYDDGVNYGDSGDAGDIIIGGSYVLGLHKVNHDITVDGFYSNFINDEYTEINTAYIEPTPPDSNYYMWSIGISAINYSFTMTASKYSSLGTYELSLREFSQGDTTFEVIGFNSEGLTPGVGLVDSNNVPKVADTEEDANSLLGLSMKSETSEWTAYGTTKFLSDNKGEYSGNKSYKTDSQALAPSLMFYLYHAKNITLNQKLGTVVITMQALTPKNEIEYDIQLITITIDLTARNYDDGNAYDASITYDKKYEMPASTSVHITNQSQFTAYFDLYAEDTFENLYGRNNDNYRAIVTDYALPVGTQITMLDYSSEDGIPEYYYYTITEEDYNQALQQLEADNEITYRINKFIRMGSTDPKNTYNEQAANEKYYDEEHERTIEEFLFIVDFEETTTSGNNLNKYIRFELRNNEDRTVVTVLGIRQNYMYFNLYDSSNMVLQQNVSFDSNYIYQEQTRHIDYETIVSYDQTSNRESIINTNYESTSMGLNVVLYDVAGNQVSSSLLTGTSIRMDGVEYFADSKGVFRIKLSGKVSNLKKDLYFLTDESLPAGKYKMKFSLFASSDGLHNSSGLEDAVQEFEITVVSSGNAIEAKSADEYKVVDGITRLNEFETSEETIRINVNENIESPNLRVSIYKRNIDNKETTAYQEIDFSNLFSTELPLPTEKGLMNGSQYERLITTDVLSQNAFTWNYADTMTSGTYRIVLKLYDGNQLIDEDQEYVIVKK